MLVRAATPEDAQDRLPYRIGWAFLFVKFAMPPRGLRRVSVAERFRNDNRNTLDLIAKAEKAARWRWATAESPHRGSGT